MQESSSTDAALPKSLSLFTSDKPPAYRLRRILFLVIFAAAGACLLWPIYPLASRIEPRVLGLPFSLIWVIFALLVVFGALIWLYSSESPSVDGR